MLSPPRSRARRPQSDSLPSRPPLRRHRLLFTLEALAVIAFAVTLVAVLLRPAEQGTLVPLDPETLASGPSSEQWMGIFFEDQPVGYAVSSQVPTRDGGVLYQGRSEFHLANLGQIQRVVTAGTALLDPTGQVRRFDVLWDADPVHLVARGEIRREAGEQEGPTEVVIELIQGGEPRTVTLEMARPPQLDLSFGHAISQRTLVVGDSFELPYFDPVTLAQSPLEVTVTGVEVLAGGEEAYWLRTRFMGVTTRKLVTPAGDILREENALGLSMVRMSPDEVEAIMEQRQPADLVGLAAVRPRIRPPGQEEPRRGARLEDARSLATVVLEVEGVDPARIPSDPPIQVREDDRVTIRMPLWAEIPARPLLSLGRGDAGPQDTGAASPPLAPPDLTRFLGDDPFLPVGHLEIRNQARRLVEGISNRRDAARAIHDWVFEAIEKRPVVGIPDGLEVLRTREGDCNEHTALAVSLARAAGIPARIAVGVVYSHEVDEAPGFFYHAWPEYHLGGETPWVPADPTLGGFPADATHLKLAEGNLDRQVEIIGLMGRLDLTVLEAR